MTNHLARICNWFKYMTVKIRCVRQHIFYQVAGNVACAPWHCQQYWIHAFDALLDPGRGAKFSVNCIACSICLQPI
uniref:Uncharacterized protein n=1 Tax=Triticum urartu TaxID=4572 RepID=A0A8R7JX01_TRIUA